MPPASPPVLWVQPASAAACSGTVRWRGSDRGTISEIHHAHQINDGARASEPPRGLTRASGIPGSRRSGFTEPLGLHVAEGAACSLLIGLDDVRIRELVHAGN